MKSPPRYLGAAGEELAKERLEQYRRYAELIAAQENALEAEDLDRFEELAERVADLRSQIGAPGEVLAEHEADVAEVLSEALSTNQRIQRRLADWRGKDAERVRRVTARGPQVKTYVAESREDPPARVDVKF